MYKIEKYPELKCWIVFEKRGSLLWEVYRARLKKDCREWVNKHGKSIN